MRLHVYHRLLMAWWIRHCIGLLERWRRVRLTWFNAWLLVALSVSLYNEYFALLFASLQFPVLVPSPQSREHFKLLLVADPQLQGYRNELSFLGYITRFDADWYLRRSFSRAFNKFDPHAIIFLGDLLDEGNIAPAEEFMYAARRFTSIFKNDGNVVKFYIPGDNDIGGEQEPVLKDREDRFRDFFAAEPDVEHYMFQYLKFFEGNYFSGRWSAVTHLFPNSSRETAVRILLSHAPLLYGFDKVAQDIVSATSPHVILSAHLHKVMLLNKNVRSNFAHIIEWQSNKIFTWSVDPNLQHEFVVPTCSYRMGVSKMGFGVMLIERFRNSTTAISAAVYWLPGRYWQLYSYLIVLAIGVLGLLVACMRHNCCNRTAPALPFYVYNGAFLEQSGFYRKQR